MLNTNDQHQDTQQIWTNTTIPNFIPIACHYDASTLLCKSGELMQIIKIQGHVDSQHINLKNSLREWVRETITNTLQTAEIGIYIHVISQNIDEKINIQEEFDSYFTAFIEKQWRAYNNWDSMLENVLYITVVHKGTKGTINLGSILTAMNFHRFSQTNFAALDNSLNELNHLTNNILEKLEVFKAKKLTIESDPINNKQISYPISFFYQLTHLKQKPIPLLCYDASEQIGDLEIEYGFNSLQIKDYEEQKETQNEKRYAAVFTIKYPYNITQIIADKLLQIQQHYILTETVVASSQKTFQEKLEKSNKIYSLSSESEELLDISGVGALLGMNHNGKINYCRQQIILTIYDKDEINLNAGIKKLITIFQETGIVAVREDANMARTFFAQLPGNFKMLKRESENLIKLAGNFTSIHHQKLGSYNGSIWGKPVSIIKNLNGKLPYYFNFHYNNEGNSLLFGPKGSGLRSLGRLLLAQATRLKPRIIVVHTDPDQKNFIKSLEGTIIEIESLEDSEAFIQYDILNLENYEGEIGMMCYSLAEYILQSSNIDDDVKILSEILEPWTKEKNIKKRNQLINNFIKKENSKEVTIIKKLKTFLQSSCYKKWFAQDLDIKITDYRTLNIDVSKIYNKSNEIKLLLGHFLMKLNKILDKQATIIYINNVDFLFKMTIFGSRIKNWLSNLTENNAIALCITYDKDMVINNPFFGEALALFVTQIFMADRLANKQLKIALELTDQELKMLKSYDRSYRAFMLRHKNDTLFSSFDLSKATELLKVIG